MKNSKRMRRLSLILAVIITTSMLFVSCGKEKKKVEVEPDPLASRYEEAISLYKDAKYDEAKKAFVALGGYRESAKYADSIEAEWAHSEIVRSDGTEESYETVFDEAGRPLEQTMTDNEDHSITVFRNTYDEKGNLIRTNEYYFDDMEFYTEYEYDDEGKVVKEKVVAGDMSGTLEYTYDENGNQILEISRTPVGDGSIESSYDRNGNLIKRVIKNEKGDVESTEEYEYDDNDNKVKYVLTTDVYTDTTEYIYEGSNLVREVNYDEEGEQAAIDYEYDGNNNLVKITESGYLGNTVTENEYDEYGNIVKTTVSSDGAVDYTQTFSNFVYRVENKIG